MSFKPLFVLLFSLIVLFKLNAQNSSSEFNDTIFSTYFHVNKSNDLSIEIPKIQSLVQESLKQKGNLLPEKIVIDGHTDNSGPEDYNFKLSFKRSEFILLTLAKNLENQLSQQYSIKIKNPCGEEESSSVTKKVQMESRGFGEIYPKFSNATAAGMAKNRRVDVIVYGKSYASNLQFTDCAVPDKEELFPFNSNKIFLQIPRGSIGKYVIKGTDCPNTRPAVSVKGEIPNFDSCTFQKETLTAFTKSAGTEFEYGKYDITVSSTFGQNQESCQKKGDYSMKLLLPAPAFLRGFNAVLKATQSKNGKIISDKIAVQLVNGKYEMLLKLEEESQVIVTYILNPKVDLANMNPKIRIKGYKNITTSTTKLTTSNCDLTNDLLKKSSFLFWHKSDYQILNLDNPENVIINAVATKKNGQTYVVSKKLSDLKYSAKKKAYIIRKKDFKSTADILKVN